MIEYQLLAVVFTVLLVPVVNLLFTHMEITNCRNSISPSSEQVPLSGGIIVFITVISFFLSDGEILAAMDLIVPLSLFFVLGLLDDYFDIDPLIRLFCQGVIIVIFLFLTDFLIKDVIITGGVLPIWFYQIVTGLFILGCVNTFNFIDGIDGLCIGLVIVGLSYIFLSIPHDLRTLDVPRLIALLIPILCVMILCNVFGGRWLKLFLGDSGSTSVGFIVSYVIIYISQNSDYGSSINHLVWIVGVVVFNASFVFGRRLCARVPLWAPDKRHFHYEISGSRLFVLLLLLLIQMLLIVGGCLLVGIGEAASILGFSVLFLSSFIFGCWYEARETLDR